MDELKATCEDYDDRLANYDNENNVLKDKLAQSEINVAEHESELLGARTELEETKARLKEPEEQIAYDVDTFKKIHSITADTPHLEKEAVNESVQQDV